MPPDYGKPNERHAQDHSSWRKLTSVWRRSTFPALMKKPKLKWNFETIFGLIIFGILGCYYIVLLFLFLLIKYL
jgi:hypothetical protein